MVFLPATLIIAGLLLMLFNKRLGENMKRMDENYTGDLVPDKENEAMHKYEKKIKTRFQRGSYYFGALLLFWGVIFLIVFLLPYF